MTHIDLRHWVVRPASDGTFDVLDCTGERVCNVRHREDALVIAQAPEMLSTLERQGGLVDLVGGMTDKGLVVSRARGVASQL